MMFDLRFYWSLFLRRLPVMTALILIGSGLGGVTALKLPATYSTSARLLVEEPQIPEGMAASTIQTDGAEQLQVIEQQLMTRANLIDIANKYKVFENIRSMTPDRVVAQMRASTRIHRTGGGRSNQATLMTLTFQASSGRIAADVVNEYVTIILEANNKFRLSRVENTLEFFQQEVTRLSAELDKQSVRIVEFKNANASALPDDLNYRLGRQSSLQERAARLERDKAGLDAQRTQVKALYESTGQIRQPDTPARQLSPEEQQLKSLQLELAQALGVLSDSHPRVQLLKTRIAQLEKTVMGQIEAATPADPAPDAPLDATADGGDGTSSVTPTVAPKTTTPLDIALAEIDARSAAIEQELAEVTAELDTLEKSIAATSSNAIQLDALERDFTNIQNRYNTAVNNLNTARMSERIEVSSQGQRITVLEGANVPQDPSGPNRKIIAAMGIAMGLGAAAAFFVLLELLNRTIRRPAELQSRFGIVPLATVPYIESWREKMLRRGLRVSAFLAVLVGVPAALYYIDSNYMPLEILASKVISKFGVL